MNRNPRWRHALGAVLLSAMASSTFAATSAPLPDNVDVVYRDPAALTEVRFNPSERRDWMADLTRYIATQASPRIAPGARLLVTITDVQRAGRTEPWRGITFNDLRFVRDTTPPIIDLVFQEVSPQGAVLKEGTRRLYDPNFLGRAAWHSGEPLGYEKNLVDDWLVRDFPLARR